MNKLRELKARANGICVLYVEDDPDLQESMRLYLGKIFDDVRVAKNGQEGLELYKQRPADIVISDILMPLMNGVEMLGRIKALAPNQNTIITSAHTESSFFIDAIKLGVNSYIIKPIDYEQMIDVLYTTVRSISQEKELDLYHHQLEETINAKIEAYKRLEDERIEDYKKILLALVKMIEQRDSYTAGHSQRVATYAKRLAQHMGYDDSTCEQLYQAGILHDIGKIATPDAILLKPERLNAVEYNLIKEHVNVGVNILKDIPMFAPLIEIIASHHERFDGGGYPHGLEGKHISPLARIMSLADAFDAMTTNRIYRHKKSVEEALVELDELSGKQFDPDVVSHARIAFNDITIETETSQMPTSALEEERFVYFYRDSVTDVYNQKYLSIMLLKNGSEYEYKHLFVFSLHNFTAYNHYIGWDAGDQLLRSLASILTQYFTDLPLFRIHANDFIVLSRTPYEINLELKKEIDALLGQHLSYSLRCFDIQASHIVSMNALEKLMNPSLQS